MNQFHYTVTDTYNEKLRIKGEDVLCYSPDRFRELYPETDPATLQEARVYSARELKPRKDGTPKKAASKKLGDMAIGKNTLGISMAGTNHRLLYKKAGYVHLSDGRFVSVCTSRVPFLTSMLLLILLTLACVLLALLLMWGNDRPIILPPDNPLPPVDTHVTPDTSGNDNPIDSPSGGGGVSMAYTLQAVLSLADNTITMHVVNPKASNHDLVITLSVLDENVSYPIATSGRIPAGNGLYTLTLDPNAPVLSEGAYKGLYTIAYYHPETGVRANVESQITDVVILVTP